VTPNTLAACYPRGEFLAIDLNAEHIANGHTLADKGGLTNIRFMETTFEDALKQPLPKFDYMVVHGVYSWVSSEVWRDIRRIVPSHS
jgi:tRNA G46 methylase TrmB